MAKTKTLEEQIAEHEAAIKKLREDAAAAALKLVAEKKTALQEALVDYNNAVKLSGGKAATMRLVADVSSASNTNKSSKARLRLSDETRTDIREKIVKAAKAHGKNGATKADIIKYLDTSGYKIGVNYNELHLFALLNTLRDGTEPSVTTVGEKAKMRYVAA